MEANTCEVCRSICSANDNTYYCFHHEDKDSSNKLHLEAYVDSLGNVNINAIFFGPDKDRIIAETENELLNAFIDKKRQWIEKNKHTIVIYDPKFKNIGIDSYDMVIEPTIDQRCYEAVVGKLCDYMKEYLWHFVESLYRRSIVQNA